MYDIVHLMYQMSLPLAPLDNTALIIGVVVAVVIVFLLTILVGFIIVLVCWKRKGTSESKGDKEDMH